MPRTSGGWRVQYAGGSGSSRAAGGRGAPGGGGRRGYVKAVYGGGYSGGGGTAYAGGTSAATASTRSATAPRPVQRTRIYRPRIRNPAREELAPGVRSELRKPASRKQREFDDLVRSDAGLAGLSRGSRGPASPRPEGAGQGRSGPLGRGQRRTGGYNFDLTKRGARDIANVLANPVGAARAFLGGRQKPFRVPQTVPRSHAVDPSTRTGRRERSSHVPRWAKPPRQRALGRWVDTTQTNDPSPINLKKVNPVLLRQAVRLGRRSGEPVEVTSGFRSKADQRVLYDRYLDSGKDPRFLAAPPGKSSHTKGEALDINLSSEQRSLLPRLSLGTPVAGDRPHVEIVGGRPKRRMGRVDEVLARSRQLAPGERQLKRRLGRAVGRAGGGLADSGGLLGPRQTEFVNELSRLTGLSARVLGGMAASEQPKDSPSIQGSDNWLNIGYFDSGPGGPTQAQGFFQGPKAAAKLTAQFLRGDALGASSGIRSIMDAAGKSEAEQIRAIQNSGWASSGHPNLPSLAAQLSARPGKDIPRGLKRQARSVLGRKTTRRILSGGFGASGPRPLPFKEVKQYIKATESKGEVAAELGVPERKWKVMITKMDPALQRALVDLAKDTGKPVRINEGFRTTKHANEFPSGTGSNHAKGLAADVDNNADFSAEELAAHGLTNTNVAGEPWHFELTDVPAGAGISYGGPMSAGGAVSAQAGTTPAQAAQQQPVTPSRTRGVRLPAFDFAARAALPSGPGGTDPLLDTELTSMLKQRFRPQRRTRGRR